MKITSPRTRPNSRDGFQVTLLLVAIATAVSATGCGGGRSEDTAGVSTAQSPSAPESATAAAKSAGVLYALTPVTGLVGEALLKQGWRVEQRMPPAGEPGALMYVDGSHELAMDAEVRKLAAGRPGALLVDSRQVLPGTLMVQSSDGLKQQYASLVESGKADLVPVEQLIQPTPTDAVRFLLALGRASAENATAILIGPASASAFHVLPDGKINHEAPERALAALSVEAIDAAQQQPAQIPNSLVRVRPTAPIQNGFKYEVSDFITPSDGKGGYRTRAKVALASQYADNSYNTLNITVALITSPTDSQIQVYQFPNPVTGATDMPAGTYPETPYRISKSSTVATLGPALTKLKIQTQLLDRNSPAANQDPTNLDFSVLSYGPTKYDDPDQTEVQYATGFSTSGVVNIGNFLASFFTPWKWLTGVSGSGGYAESTSVKRVTNQWTSNSGSVSNTPDPYTYGEFVRKNRSYQSSIGPGPNPDPLARLNINTPSDLSEPFRMSQAPSQFTGAMIAHSAVYKVGAARTNYFKSNPSAVVGVLISTTLDQEDIQYTRRVETGCTPNYRRGGCTPYTNYYNWWNLTNIIPSTLVSQKLYFIRPACTDSCSAVIQ